MPAAAKPLLASYPVLDTTDLDVVRAVTGRAWGEHESDVVGRDPYRLRLNRTEGGRLPVTFVDCTARIEARMEGTAAQFQVLVPITGGVDMELDGLRLSASPGQAAFVRPLRSMRFVAAPSRCLLVDLPEVVMEEWLGDHAASIPEVSGRVLAGRAGARVVSGAIGLARLHERGSAPVPGGHRRSAPSGVPLAEASLVARIGAFLLGSSPPPRDEPPGERVVVEDLLRWLRDNRAEPVGMRDLAAHARVSLRALEQAFARHVGATPSECLRAMRLDLARQRLESARPGSDVTAVVLGAGFSHLGRFAGGYRSRFGELPSETLRRARR